MPYKAKLIAIALVILSSVAIADNEATEPKNIKPMSDEQFKQFKQEVVERLKERGLAIQKTILCVQGAGGPEQMKTCRREFKSSLKRQYQQHQSDRKDKVQHD
jgi:hypothetical protein